MLFHNLSRTTDIVADRGKLALDTVMVKRKEIKRRWLIRD